MKNAFAAIAFAVVLSACALMDSAPAATATIQPKSGTELHGKLRFTEIAPNRVRITGMLVGHLPGAKGFHIHEKGDCNAPDAMSAGGHFNPAKRTHGASPTTGHAGDMGNITFNEFGRSEIDMVVDGLSLNPNSANGIIGRAVVIHMQPDDLKTDPTGNAGGRAGCGVIGAA